MRGSMLLRKWIFFFFEGVRWMGEDFEGGFWSFEFVLDYCEFGSAFLVLEGAGVVVFRF